MNRKTLSINEKLELRLPELEFAEHLFRVVDEQRIYLGKWLPWVKQTKKPSDSFAFLKTSRLFNQGGQKLITFIFNENKLVGSVGLVKISKENNAAELGYWLSEKMQGKGIATQSCARLIKYAFEKKRLNRIEISVVSENQPSIAVAKNLGFKYEGTLREKFFINEKYHDLQKFSLLRKEWQVKK